MQSNLRNIDRNPRLLEVQDNLANKTFMKFYFASVSPSFKFCLNILFSQFFNE